ncbi:glycosyltransferase family 2 protein [Salegentibacter sp. Hel_I_6]|uniref:glycosyltransferase n=1 Tax=Salegentibacter sp. Hel_I_6 TaxID=1250278 RepID=UPI000561ADD8|nr:glycosyltransferase [Salegentibacter sp. Hel_I_6]
MNNNSSYSTIHPSVKFHGKHLPSPKNGLKLIVTIPAKNEAGTIWKTLSALLNQRLDNASLPPDFYEVIILCNHCDDDTVAICNLFQKIHPQFPLYIFETVDRNINSVGASRRILMDLASSRLPGNGFIITTDADTIAHKKWLNAFLESLPEPVDLICGIIQPDNKGLNLEAKKILHLTRRYLDLVSRLESEIFPQDNDPWPRHSHNSGPNMAIRKSVYEKLGGIPPLACFEDIALYQKVFAYGYKIKHSYSPIIITSCRTSSRVPGGFGSQIRNWSDSKTENVEGLRKLEERFKAYNNIRSYYQNPSSSLLNTIAEQLHFKSYELESLLQKHERSNSIIIYLENSLKTNTSWNSAYPNIPLEKAIEELENYFSVFSHTTNSYSS